MYKDKTIPNNYNKIAEISDNYVVWVKENKLQSGVKYNAFYQYIYPSTCVIFTEDYKITDGDSYTYNVNYYNNGMYSYIDNYTVSFEKSTMSIDSENVSGDDYSRADFPQIFQCQFIVVIIFVWVFSQLSRLFFKGGLR